jgi:MFS family permease
MNGAGESETMRIGIYYGWLIAATTCVIAFVTIGSGNSGFGVFVIPMSAEFGWQRGTISLAAALGSLMSGLSQPFAGRLYDRWGGRTLILISLALSGLCTVLLALTTQLLVLILLFGVLRSVALSGCSLSISAALLAKWFRRKRATVVALNAAGASAGGLLLIPLTAWVIQSASWRMAWVMLGLLLLILALPLAVACLRNDPAEMGLRPDGDAQPIAAGQAEPARLAPLEATSWRDAFGSLPIWQLCGGYFVCGFSVALVATHFVPFAIERGFSPTLAASAYGLMSGLNVVGVLAVGVLSDRWGRKIPLGGVYALRGCAFLALILVPSDWSLWLFVVVLGFSWWATLPLTNALTADVYGLSHLGTLNGMVFLGHQIGGALSIQLGGLLHDLTGSYELPFAVAGLLLFIASLVSFTINERKYAISY